MERLARLKTIVRKVDHVWECTVDEEIHKNSEMKSFFTDCQAKGRIDPRDAVSLEYIWYLYLVIVLVLWRAYVRV
jgi:G:T-mismatch repair DNA endonuclease (very short patch repair protein)